MVNTVKKGAGRPAAKARTAKAAQRTPLPAKPPKADAPVEPVMPTANAKSKVKADDFIAAAKQSGWRATLSATGTDTVKVTAKRGDEVLEIEWDNGVYKGIGEYRYGSDRAIKLHNASAGKQRMGVSPQEAAEAAAKSATRPNRKVKVDDSTEHKSRVPFDVETSTDDEVIALLRGKTITWRNRNTQLIEQAFVLPKQRHIEIVVRHNRRILNFLAEEGGFRSVYLESIKAVV